jgi:hypothetical protein
LGLDGGVTQTIPSSSRRAVWIGVAAVLAGALVVVAVVLVLGRDDGQGGDEPRRTLGLPRDAAGYAIDRSGPARRYARTTEADLRSQVPGTAVVVGTYARESGAEEKEQIVFVGFSFPAGSDQGDALAASAPDALRDYFASAGVDDLRPYDAGPLGGALLCGRFRPGAGPPQVTCGWADGATLGTLRFATGSLADGPAGDAAAVTADFRADVSGGAR